MADLRADPVRRARAGDGAGAVVHAAAVRLGQPLAGASAAPSSGAAASPGANSPARGIDNAERELGPTGLPAVEETPIWVKIGIGVAVALLLSLIPAFMRAGLWLWRRRVLNRAAAVPDEEVPVVRPDADDDGWGGGEVIGGKPAASKPVSVWAAPEEPVAPAPQENTFAAPAVEAAWAELCDTLIDLGMPKAGSETPRALGRRLAAAYPLDTEAAKALSKIATSEEKLRYARTPGETTPLVDDLKAVRRGLAASVSRGRRIAAVLAPMSALLRVRGLGERILDGFDRLEGIRLRPARKEHETATPDDVLESQVGSRRQRGNKRAGSGCQPRARRVSTFTCCSVLTLVVTTAPALLHAFHEAGTARTTAVRPFAAAWTTWSGCRRGNRSCVSSWTGPTEQVASMTTKPADPEPDDCGHDADHQQDDAECEADGGLHQAALVMAAWVTDPDGIGPLRVLGIEGLLDLFEQALLVLR